MRFDGALLFERFEGLVQALVSRIGGFGLKELRLLGRWGIWLAVRTCNLLSFIRFVALLGLCRHWRSPSFLASPLCWMYYVGFDSIAAGVLWGFLEIETLYGLSGRDGNGQGDPTEMGRQSGQHNFQPRVWVSPGPWWKFWISMNKNTWFYYSSSFREIICYRMGS